MPRAVLPYLHLQLGSFYRDRTGHKYVCYAELPDNVAEVRCLRVHDACSLIYRVDGVYDSVNKPMSDALSFVEEVRPDSPLFVDPTALLDGIDYEAMWDRVQAMPSGIEIVKFSPKTATRDVTLANKDIPSDIRNKLDRNNIGKLWRVRLNKQTRARYEWDVDKAVALVMSRLEPSSE